MKTCNKCQLDKETTDFYKNKNHCKECDKQYSAKRVNAISEYIKNLNLKCVKCGESHIAVLDFHHIDPSKKEFSISSAKSDRYSIDRIKKELEKCIPLCANCHRLEHWKD